MATTEGFTMLATPTWDCVKVIGLVVGLPLVPESVAVTVLAALPKALTFMRT